MSSSPTAPTSTTGSSSSSRSEGATARTALLACGALAQPAAAIAARRGWPLDVHPLPPLLHNQPQLIAGEVRALAETLAPSYAAASCSASRVTSPAISWGWLCSSGGSGCTSTSQPRAATTWAAGWAIAPHAISAVRRVLGEGCGRSGPGAGPVERP